MQNKTLLTSKETAEFLGIGVSTLYRYKKMDDFPKTYHLHKSNHTL